MTHGQLQLPLVEAANAGAQNEWLRPKLGCRRSMMVLTKVVHFWIGTVDTRGGLNGNWLPPCLQESILYEYRTTETKAKGRTYQIP